MNRNIEGIIKRQYDHGGPFWSRADGDIHAPHGYSTIDTLSVLGELDVSYDTFPGMKEVVEFVFSYQTADGSFRYSKKSPKLPCMTGRILSALGKLKVSDERMGKGYQQLLDTQWHDGGWRCHTVRLGKSPQTDAANPGTTLYVLDAFRFRKNSPDEIKQLEQGVFFLLRHWAIKEPLGPCNFGIGSRFFQIEYPFLRYNVFYFVHVLSFYPIALNDQRFKEACKLLADKIENDTVIPEKPHRAWQGFDFANKGKASGPASKRWLEIKMNIEKR